MRCSGKLERSSTYDNELLTTLRDLQQLLLRKQFQVDRQGAEAAAERPVEGCVALVSPCGKTLIAPDLGRRYHCRNWKAIERERWCCCVFVGQRSFARADKGVGSFFGVAEGTGGSN